jgi:hypothetical protein
MRKQQHIPIQRCFSGFWHSLTQATVLQTISNDLFNGRMEKVYPYRRPECIHT